MLKVIIIILAVLLFILLMPIRGRIYIKYIDDDLTTVSELYLWFLKIPIRKKKKTESGEDDSEAEEQSDDESGGGVWRAAYRILSNLDNIKRFVKRVLSYASKHLIKIKKLMFRAEIGVDDAMYTALLYGAVSAVVYGFAGAADEYMRLSEHDIELKADFDDPHIYAELDSIISTNILHIIIITMIAARHAVPIWVRNRKKEKNNGESDQGTC